MVVLTVWYFERDGIVCHHLKAHTYGEAFDRATSLGAVRALDGFGQVWRWIGGEWVSIP